MPAESTSSPERTNQVLAGFARIALSLLVLGAGIKFQLCTIEAILIFLLSQEISRRRRMADENLQCLRIADADQFLATIGKRFGWIEQKLASRDSLSVNLAALAFLAPAALFLNLLTVPGAMLLTLAISVPLAGCAIYANRQYKCSERQYQARVRQIGEERVQQARADMAAARDSFRKFQEQQVVSDARLVWRG